MNRYVLSHQLSFILLYVPFCILLISYSYRDLMVQVISGRWCACVLATSLKVAMNELHNAARGTTPPPPPPPPPISLEQLLATQNELMRVLMENLVQHEVRPPHRHLRVKTSYTNFLAMHPSTFAEVTDPLVVDNWLRMIESKFGLLHCTEFQKTLFMVQ
jgi:hypothetical protein